MTPFTAGEPQRAYTTGPVTYSIPPVVPNSTTTVVVLVADTSSGWRADAEALRRGLDAAERKAKELETREPGGARRSKQKPPLWKRTAKRRRRTALAKHHRKVMNLAALRKAGKRVSYPRRPRK